MPVYEYECKTCEKVHEVQQKMSEKPLSNCPQCQGPVTKLMSMSSFQLKGGGWYADGYASKSAANDKGNSTADSGKPAAAAPAAKAPACAGCPAAAST